MRRNDTELAKLESSIQQLNESVDRLTQVMESATRSDTLAKPDTFDNFIAQHPTPKLIQIPEGEKPPWLTEAEKHIGIDEVEDEELVLRFAEKAGTPIDSSNTPWCAIFTNAMLAESGIETTGTARARDFADWGQECKERVGAVVVFRSHVGFVPKIGEVLGGNQSDGVNVGEQKWYGKPIAFRWPEGYAV